MQLSREGSGRGGRCHHRSLPADPPTIDSTDPAPHRRRRNRYDYAKYGRRRVTTLGGAEVLRKGARGGVTERGGGRREGECTGPLLSGERKRYGRGRAEALPERPAAGVGWRAPDHYSRGSGVAKEGARGGLTGGCLTAGAHQRRDERCRDRRGERRSHGRGQEQVWLEERTPALLEGGRRHY